MVELLLAILVIAIAMLSTYGAYVASKHANHVSEVHESMTHLAQKELERLQAMPYNEIGLTSAPTPSSNPTNPNYYVSNTPSASCPSFQWNQSPGQTPGPSNTDLLIVAGATCNYPSQQYYAVQPVQTVQEGPVTYTMSDFVTWVNDGLCLPGVGCPLQYDYKRVTVEVTAVQPSSQRPRWTPAAPVLASALLTDPHPVTVAVGNINASNPEDSTTATCMLNGQQTTCNYGLSNQTANTFYLTNSLEANGYSPPTGNNPCMHYTDQLVPLLGLVNGCGSSNLGVCTLLLGVLTNTGCPQPDLLNATAPPLSIPQEYNFSPNLSASASGRVILRDSKASSCTATPSNDARTAEIWTTQPLGTQLDLSGSGGMTLYTSTLHGLSASVTLCIGVYLESPVLGLLDPLNLLGSSDSVQLGVYAFTQAQWPAVPSPLSFTFNYMTAAKLAAAGTSIGIRVWVTASSGDDIVLQYDAPSVASNVQINSEPS
jgi:Tfp pilus assembly protein PilV